MSACMSVCAMWIDVVCGQSPMALLNWIKVDT